MNSIFSFIRFNRLANQYFTLGWKHLAISSLVMLGIAKIILGVSLHLSWFDGGLTADNIADVFSTMQNSIFKTWLAISGTIFAASSFNDLGKRPEGIAMLMTPATHFEKFFLRFLLSTVYFLVVGVVLFCFASFVNIEAFNSIRPLKIPLNTIGSLFSGETFQSTLGNFFFFQSIFLLGSI